MCMNAKKRTNIILEDNKIVISSKTHPNIAKKKKSLRNFHSKKNDYLHSSQTS